MNTVPRLKFDAVAGIMLLSVSVLFCLVVGIHFMKDSYFQNGDTIWHYSNEFHLLRSIEQGQGIFSCFSKGFGIPVFNFYHPLLYLLVVGIHLLSFKAIPIVFIHNCLVGILFCLYPLSVFYFARSFRFSTFKSGAISLFSMFAISGCGHTINAYFDLGLHTQLIGTACVALFMGAMSRLNWSNALGRNLAMLVISFCCLMTGHAVFTLLLAYIIPLYIVCYVLKHGWGDGYSLVKKLIFAGIVSVVAVSFWLVPFIMFNQEYKCKSRTELSGSPIFVSLTPKGFFNCLFTGEILDNTRPGSVLTADGNKGPRWSTNSSMPRYGIFSIFALIGFIVFLLKIKRFRELFFVLLFFWGIFLFLGSDDVPWLRFLPFISEFQAIRAIFIIELVCAVFAGDVFVRIFTFLYGVIKKSADRHPLARISAACGLAVLIIALCIPLSERYRTASSLIDFSKSKEFIEVDRMFRNFRVADPSARIYSDQLPGVPRLSSFANCYFLNHVDDLIIANDTLLSFDHFYRYLFVSPHLLDLFYVKNIITSTDGRKLSPLISSHVTFSGNYCSNHAIDSDSTFFSVPARKPVLVACSDETWLYLNELWLRWYTEKGKRIPHLVRARGEWLDDVDPAVFSAIIVFDSGMPAKNTDRYHTVLNDFIRRGGTVLSNTRIGELPVMIFNPATQLEQTISAVLTESPQVSAPAQIVPLESTWHSQRIKCANAVPQIIVAKTLYYHTWHAYQGETRLKTVLVSPGFTGILLPPCNSFIHFTYDPSRLHTIFFVAGIILIALVCLTWRTYRSVLAGHVVRSQSSILPHQRVYYYALIILMSAYLGGLYIRQEAFGKTSLIYPPDGASKISPVVQVFRWNRLSQNELYDVQLSKRTDFADTIYTESGTKDTFLVHHWLEPSQTYYWRVKVTRPDKTSSWSSTYQFTTGQY